MKRFKNIEYNNKEKFEKQLKPIQNDINNAKIVFRKLRFLNKLGLEA